MSIDMTIKGRLLLTIGAIALLSIVCTIWGQGEVGKGATFYFTLPDI